MPGDGIPAPATLSTLEDATLYPSLGAPSQAAIRRIAARYRLTFQERRRLAVIARDLEMWQERPLDAWWDEVEAALAPGPRGRQRKKRLLGELERRIEALRKEPPAYPEEGLPPPEREGLKLLREASETRVLGRCPVASPRTVCCNLWTLDGVENCLFGCSYCTIQTFYGRRALLDARLEEKLGALALDPRRFYHIGTGQSSDSLAWGNTGGLLDTLCRFAGSHPNVLLELKTKSANVSYFLECPVPRNVVLSWSLNPERIIRSEEHFTASLERRLAAARRVADRGVAVAFHLHPVVRYQGWEEEYRALVRRLLGLFRPPEVLFVSLGTLTFIQPVLAAIRRRGGATRVLHMEMVPDPHGKLTYPDAVKLELYRALYTAFEPWHGRVFFYLCMEHAELWHAVLGRSYEANEHFEADLARHAFGKLGLPLPPSVPPPPAALTS